MNPSANFFSMVVAAVKNHPQILPYLDWEMKAIYYKAAPISRAELEQRLARLVLVVDKGYLATLAANGARVPFDFWQNYETDLRAQIAAPLRGYIEQSFTNYSDYVNFIDKAGAVGDIDTAMTQAISEVARGIAQNTQAQLQALISSGLTEGEILDSIALRFSSGHAEQIAITEITRAEAQFSEALSSRLAEQGVTSQIRWLAAEDEKMCPICKKLDHKLKGSWTVNGMDYNSGPPAHPNCRCQTVVELTR
jgi:hypothetical protein